VYYLHSLAGRRNFLVAPYSAAVDVPTDLEPEGDKEIVLFEWRYRPCRIKKCVSSSPKAVEKFEVCGRGVELKCTDNTAKGSFAVGQTDRNYSSAGRGS